MAWAERVTPGKEEIKRRFKACKLRPPKSEDWIAIKSDNVINMMKGGKVHAYENDGRVSGLFIHF